MTVLDQLKRVIFVCFIAQKQSFFLHFIFVVDLNKLIQTIIMIIEKGITQFLKEKQKEN